VKAFLERPIEGDWPYVWIDATYLKVRQNGRIVSVAVTIAVGVNSDGRREVLGMAIGASEAETFWTDLPSAASRVVALRGVKLTRTSDLVQKLQVARRELSLEAAIAKLDKYHLLILDDLAYVSKDQAETSVLFELISARYERRSTLITANQPFGEWTRVFPDPAMTLAAVDRLVHHSTIFEMNVDSYRRRAALERKQQGPGRPPTRATISDSDVLSSRDNQLQT
jgi:hypothetical protein